MTEAIVVQQPAGPSDRLMLLFHGVGASAQHMVPLGRHLARAFPGAFVVAIDGTQPSDLGAGRQWFSIRGVTEENRTARIEAAMPAFRAVVGRWQEEAEVDVADTVLIGFSQGAIMSLAATQADPLLAGRVVAIAGRFAQPPARAPRDVTVHLVHGQVDSVIPFQQSVAAVKRWNALGGTATLDLFPTAEHEIDAAMAMRIVERLTPVR